MLLKKPNFINILLITMLSLFLFSLSNTAIYNYNINLIEKLSNNFYEKNSLIFSTEKQNYSFDEVYYSLPNQGALFGLIKQYDQNIRSICFKGNYTSPLLSWGRFFKEEDFTGNTFLAVVGKDIEITRTEGEKKYIQIGDFDYEIIGIMEYNMPTRLDNSIFLAGNNENFILSDKYIISCKNTQDSFDFLGNEQLFGQVIARPYESVNVLHVIDRNNNQKILSAIFLTVLSINSISIMQFWLENKRREMNIKIINGYQKYQVLLDICKEFSIHSVLSVLIVIVFAPLFIAHIQKYSFQLSMFMFSIAAGILLLNFSLILQAICILHKPKGVRRYDSPIST